MPNLLIAAFLSDVAALNYELLWMRELTLLLGSTQAAISIVLAVYFLGLALGNEIAGRAATRLNRPMAAYVTAELVIAVWALIFHPLLDFVGDLYAQSYQSLSAGSSLNHLLRAAGAAAILLIPTTCMGVTLPLLAQFGTRNADDASKWSGRLYGANTLGAMLGTALTGFFLIEHLGVSVSLRATCLANVACAACVLPWFKRPSLGVEQPSTPRNATPISSADRRLLLAFGVLGFCNIAAEVLWTRFYALIFLNDTYIFSTILITYLLGVGAGSLIGGASLRRVKHPVYTLGVLQIVSGAWTVAMIYIVPAMLPRLDLHATQFDAVLKNYFLCVSAGTLVPTLCMGASFPILVRTVVSHRNQTGAIVGRALSWNTIGGVAGAAVAGYIFLDRLGLQAGILIVAAATAAVGFALAESHAKGRRRLWQPVIVLLLPAVTALLVRPPRLPDSLIEYQFPQRGGFRILESRPSVHGTVAITEESSGERRVWINSIWVAREHSHMVMGYIPWLMHAGPIDDCLGICCGTARTFGALLNVGVQNLDLVEINPAVIDLSRQWFARSNHGVLSDPQARIITDDGRNFVRYTDRSYDLITLEPLQMFQKGVVYFYTQDFYREAKMRLNPNGVLCQWLPIYLMNEYECKSMIRTFVEVFPTAILWGQAGDMLLIGFNTSGPAIDFDEDEIQLRLRTPALRTDLSRQFVTDKYDAYVFTLADGAGLAAISQGGGIYTDDHPELEFTAARGRQQQESARLNRQMIRRNLVPLSRLFDFPSPEVLEEVTHLRALFLDLASTARGPAWDAITRRIAATRKRLYPQTE